MNLGVDYRVKYEASGTKFEKTAYHFCQEYIQWDQTNGFEIYDGIQVTLSNKVEKLFLLKLNKPLKKVFINLIMKLNFFYPALSPAICCRPESTNREQVSTLRAVTKTI